MTVAPNGGRAEGGIRVLDPFSDLSAVVDLIAIAFGDRLDPAGKATLERMRHFAQGGPLLHWAWTLLGKSTMAPGLVWEVGDRLVGNVSLRRARGGGGYLIGNVVVHADYRGRGIGEALMRRAIRVVSRRGAPWVGLEVRADNDVARRLYDRLGFHEVGRTHHLLCAARERRTEGRVRSQGIRRARSADGDALVSLMRSVVPEDQRPLLEIQEDDYRPSWTRRLERWLRGEDEVWWVALRSGQIAGAVRAVRKRGAFPNELELVVRQEIQTRLAVDLVRQGAVNLGGSPGKPSEVCVPQGTDPLVRALEGEGFQRSRVLVQMKRRLRHRIPVQAGE